MSLDDGHSVNVVNQAIDRIILPLLRKLKQQDEHNLIRFTTALLSRFVAAFDHHVGQWQWLFCLLFVTVGTQESIFQEVEHERQNGLCKGHSC